MPRHATGLHAVQTGHQSVAPPRSATASRCAPSQGSRLLGIAPAPAAAPWFRPPESVGNHVNILSTTVVLEADALPDLLPEEQKRRLQHACVQVLLEHATAQPLCLLIEDLHWLDPSSQERLDVLVTAVAGQPILVLGTTRPGFRDSWSDYTYYHRLTVTPLSEALTATFIDHYLQPYGAAPALTALLRTQSAGNPFFLEEMLQTLQEQALLVAQDNVYDVL